MAEVAELPQTPQFHMVKKKKGGERLNWNVPNETFKANWGTLLSRPILLAAQLRAKLNPVPVRKPFHPITAHSHGRGLHLPRFWTDLMVPHLKNPTCPSPHLHPELNTAAGLIKHHSRALALRNLQCRAAKREDQLKNPLLSPLLPP